MSLENVIITVERNQKQLEKFKANFPNLKSLRGFLSGEWDLSAFDKCFKGNNRLGDIDGSIELNGHTLVVEFKGAKNGMNKGQILKAIRMAKYSNIVTIFVFGKQNQPEAYLKITPAKNEKGFACSDYILADMDMIHDQLLRWADYTEKNNQVHSKTEEWNEVSAVMSKLYATT